MKLLFVFAILVVFALAFAQQQQDDAVDGAPEVVEIEEDASAPRFKRQFGYGGYGRGFGGGYGGGYGYGRGGYGGGFGRPRTVIVKKIIIRGGGPMYG
uniref:Uncharacterized protein n=1 Tax=Panagrolaimus superbus TaxID=310955 RepID=A0A914Z8W6_9BILA